MEQEASPVARVVVALVVVADVVESFQGIPIHLRVTSVYTDTTGVTSGAKILSSADWVFS